MMTFVETFVDFGQSAEGIQRAITLSNGCRLRAPENVPHTVVAAVDALEITVVNIDTAEPFAGVARPTLGFFHGPQ